MKKYILVKKDTKYRITKFIDYYIVDNVQPVQQKSRWSREPVFEFIGHIIYPEIRAHINDICVTYTSHVFFNKTDIIDSCDNLDKLKYKNLTYLL